MANYVEDATDTPTALETQLIEGLSFDKLDRLRKQLLPAVLTEPSTNARARRLIQIAAHLEPGALFDGYFSDVYLASEFRSKQKLLDIDALLSPYYGLVTPSMSELRRAGLDPAITDMWLYHFRQDNGIYRTTVVAGMCVVGAYSDTGFLVSV